MRAIASSPSLVSRKPPPTTMRSVLAQALVFEEATGDMGEFLRELLDRAVHHGGRLGVVADQHVVERLLADLLRRHVAERVLAGLAQRLAPAVEDLAERALGGAVAEKPFVVLQFDVEAVDIDRGQARSAMMGDARGGNDVVSHAVPALPCCLPGGTTAREPIGFTGHAGRAGEGRELRKSAKSFDFRPVFGLLCLDSRAPSRYKSAPFRRGISRVACFCAESHLVFQHRSRENVPITTEQKAGPGKA